MSASCAGREDRWCVTWLRAVFGNDVVFFFFLILFSHFKQVLLSQGVVNMISVVVVVVGEDVLCCSFAQLTNYFHDYLGTSDISLPG